MLTIFKDIYCAMLHDESGRTQEGLLRDAEAMRETAMTLALGLKADMDLYEDAQEQLQNADHTSTILAVLQKHGPQTMSRIALHIGVGHRNIGFMRAFASLLNDSRIAYAPDGRHIVIPEQNDKNTAS